MHYINYMSDSFMSCLFMRVVSLEKKIEIFKFSFEKRSRRDRIWKRE